MCGNVSELVEMCGKRKIECESLKINVLKREVRRKMTRLGDWERELSGWIPGDDVSSGQTTSAAGVSRDPYK